MEAKDLTEYLLNYSNYELIDHHYILSIIFILRPETIQDIISREITNKSLIKIVEEDELIKITEQSFKRITKI